MKTTAWTQPHTNYLTLFYIQINGLKRVNDVDGPLPLTLAQDSNLVIYVAISVFMEAVCFPLILVSGYFVLFL